ncbi:MAG: hypothetical protein ACRDOI_31335 [Trebonia sp.]
MTRPFGFEGKRRAVQAETGIERPRYVKSADGPRVITAAGLPAIRGGKRLVLCRRLQVLS